MQGHSELLERSLDENGSGEARLYRANHPKFANQTFYITLSDGSTGFTVWQGGTEEEARKAFARYTH